MPVADIQVEGDLGLHSVTDGISLMARRMLNKTFAGENHPGTKRAYGTHSLERRRMADIWLTGRALL
jgi:hypothetical protein